MTKLTKLRAIRDQLMLENDWSAAQANTYIGILLPIRSQPRSKTTVDRWFNESQTDPIPDNLLELLALKVKK